MVRKKVRDIYGNWVWEDEDSSTLETASKGKSKEPEFENPNADIDLEFKDYIALTLASLQTIFLPVVIVGVLFLVLAIIFTHSI